MKLFRKAIVIIHGFTGNLYDNEYLMNYLEDDVFFEKIQELTLQLQKNGIECQRIDFDIRRNVKLYIGNSEALLGGEKVHDYQISALKKVLDASGGVAYIYDLRNYTPESGEITGKKINNVE